MSDARESQTEPPGVEDRLETDECGQTYTFSAFEYLGFGIDDC